MTWNRAIYRTAVAAAAIVAISIPAVAKADEVDVNLRAGASPPMMAPSGPMKPGTVFWEPQGLRIKLAADRKPLDHVGTRTRFGASGDFQITASCDLLHAEEKSSFVGSGARLFVKLDSPKGEVASLSRVKREAGGDVYLAYFVWKDAAGKQQESRKQIPAKSKSGRLRILRTDNQLHYQAADDEQEFQQIHTVECGEGDLTEISLTATTGFHPAATEVRWKDLEVLAVSLPTREALTKSEPSRFWYWVAAGIAAVGVAVAIPVGIRLRRRK